MGKLIVFTVLATLFAFGVCVDVPTSAFESRHTAADEAKLSAFTKIGEKNYMIEAEQKLTWFGAAHFCRRMDAQLATIESEEEWKELNSYLISKENADKYYYWFSGNNLDDIGEFYWLSTGQPMHYTKWVFGKPSGVHDHCTYLWRQGNEFLMNDQHCGLEAAYICEAPKPKTVTITIW